MKLGRNELCSCGSGKKYKKCCASPEISLDLNAEVGDFGRVKLRNLEGKVFEKHLIPYVASKLPKGLAQEVLEELMPFDIPDHYKESIADNFFVSWLIFNWKSEEPFAEEIDHNLTLGENYLKAYGYKLNQEDRTFIEAMNQTYYSFYSVLKVEPGHALVMKDIMLGTEHRVKEKEGTQYFNRGDIVFNRILTIADQSISVGMVPWVIPADYHSEIIDFREAVKKVEKEITPELMRGDLQFDLEDYLFSIIERSLNPRVPHIRNTDDEPIVFTKSYFKTELTPEDVLKKLSDMTLGENTKHFLNDAKRNKDGSIKSLEFPWLKQGNKKQKSLNITMDTTILGHFFVEKGRVILETNSQKRAEDGRRLIDKNSKGAIQFQQMLLESFEEKMKENPSKKLPSKEPKEIPFRDLPPEVQRKMKELAEQHWESCFDTSIPMLGNQTPKEAAQSEGGREKLEALFLLYERLDKNRRQDDVMRTNVSHLRGKLGLEPIASQGQTHGQ